MAKPVEFSLHLGSLETGGFALSLTYRIEEGETDVLALAREKAREAKAIREHAGHALQSDAAPDTSSGETRPVPAGVAGTRTIPEEEDSQAVAEPALTLPAALPVGRSTDTAEEAEAPDECTAAPLPATAAQLCLIESLWLSLGYNAESKRSQVLAASGSEDPDTLTCKQAARIIVDLAGASRARLEREREGESRQNRMIPSG